MATINRAIRYQIFPTEQQKQQLAQTFGCARKVYNMGLALQEQRYKDGEKHLSMFDLNTQCNHTWKEEMPYLRAVDKFALTNSLKNLEQAYTNFFEKRAKHPAFKSKHQHYQSYTTNFTNNNIAIEFPKTGERGQIKLPKLGRVDALLYRKPGSDWTIKTATITYTASGKYMVSICFAIPAEEPAPVMPTIERTLGLDYSSPNFYVDSNGQSPKATHWFRKSQQQLAREQRRLSRMVKGSQHYEKQRLRVARLAEHVANQRKDFCHKLSREIVNSYDVVCVEDLDLHNMAQSLRFGKATNDNGFGMFRVFLRYKLEEQGKHFVVIDKWYPSSKTCHECGTINTELRLGEGEWFCSGCGRVVDRDYNAALNIRDEGFMLIINQLAA